MPRSVKVKGVWSYTFFPPVCLHCMPKGSFISTCKTNIPWLSFKYIPVYLILYLLGHEASHTHTHTHTHVPTVRIITLCVFNYHNILIHFSLSQ